MQWKATLFFWLVSNLAFALSPQEALQRLVEGNQRYTENHPLHPNQSQKQRTNLVEQREKLVDGQSPFATILGCADSRVPPEIIFDQGLGDLFVVRVAGNVAGSIELESIEYSATVLSSPLIVVLGHASCGAVIAVRAKQAANIQNIAALIQPAIQNAKNIEDAIKDNVRATVASLKKNKAIQQLLLKKKIDCIGAYYHLDTGLTEILQ